MTPKVQIARVQRTRVQTTQQQDNPKTDQKNPSKALQNTKRNRTLQKHKAHFAV